MQHFPAYARCSKHDAGCSGVETKTSLDAGAGEVAECLHPNGSEGIQE